MVIKLIRRVGLDPGGVGFMTCVLASGIFWVGVGSCTSYAIDATKENREVGRTCTMLIDYGLDMPIDKCVRYFLGETMVEVGMEPRR